MGTNLYYHLGEDLTEADIKVPSAGLHVGKSSAGWSFGFRAYRLVHAGENPDEQRISKVVFAIESRQDWALFFRSMPGILVTEYGNLRNEPDSPTPETPDAEAWVLSLGAPDRKQIYKEMTPEMRGPSSYPSLYDSGPLYGAPREWRDPEGFRFYDGEFS